MTVNQTIRQTRKVRAYFRQSVVQKWGQGQQSHLYPHSVGGRQTFLNEMTPATLYRGTATPVWQRPLHLVVVVTRVTFPGGNNVSFRFLIFEATAACGIFSGKAAPSAL